MKRIIIAAVLLLGSAGVFAQNLNPVVEVTNIYAREATGIEKPSQLLEMPDSVLRFNLDMDYTVRNTPYQGSYEFKPYLVQLRPQVRLSEESRLYVRAGAGYSLHPEATVIWTPVRKDHFRLNLFADHASYFGNYRNIALQGDTYQADGTFRSGKAMRTAAGADALFTWTGGALTVDGQYNHVLGTDMTKGDLANNVFRFRARVKSAPGAPFEYEAGTRLSHISQNLFHEFHTVSDGSVGAHFGAHRLRLGLLAETVSQPAGFVGNFGLLPHYLLNVGDFHMDLGVKVAFLVRSDAAFCPHPGGVVFPDVRISYDVAPDVAVIYASATGGNQLISYDFLLTRNPFIAGFYWQTDNMITRVDAALGVRGNFSERFHYDLKGGYKWDENAWTWGVVGGIPGMGYASPLHTFYGRLEAGWKDERLDVEADIYYGYTPIPDLNGQTLFAPAPFKASGHAFYSWGGRIRAGAVVEARSAMPGPRKVAGYVDLGLQAELRMTRKLGFWLKGGNLLNQTIQRVPFYAEQGIYFTVGAALTL